MEEMIYYTRNKAKYKTLNKHLNTLDAMVGMEDLKEAVVSQIQFILCNNGKIDEHFLNTVLQGPPGCGKTTVAEVLFNIWASLDLFDDETEFTIVHRSDLVGTYMGQTATKTMKLLTKLSGGVIFIDEAYSLMNGEKDDYGKEALDQINAFLSEEKGKTIMILAGYEKDLDARVFDSNPGLRRRFGWHFSIKPYTADELYKIFVKQLRKHRWTCERNVKELFTTYFDRFEHAGGDTENIAFKAKLAYAKDNWNRRKQNRRLTKEHVEKAMEETLVHKEDTTYVNMYM
jgi:stage V sporulation protein K